MTWLRRIFGRKRLLSGEVTEWRQRITDARHHRQQFEQCWQAILEELGTRALGKPVRDVAYLGDQLRNRGREGVQNSLDPHQAHVRLVHGATVVDIRFGVKPRPEAAS